jgi:hypothetical protein
MEVQNANYKAIRAQNVHVHEYDPLFSPLYHDLLSELN